jgi:hypothetical protein
LNNKRKVYMDEEFLFWDDRKLLRPDRPGLTIPISRPLAEFTWKRAAGRNRIGMQARLATTMQRPAGRLGSVPMLRR